MSLNEMQVFSDFAYNAATEVVAQQVDAFNAASNGAIVLRGAANVGDYDHNIMYASIAGLVRRRNAYGTGAVTGVNMTQMNETAVKVAAGTPPVTYEPQQFTWVQRNPEEAGVMYGEQLAKAMMQDMLNSTVRAARAAIVNVGAPLLFNGTAGTASFNALNNAAGGFGDRMGDIRAWIVHSKSLTDIYDAALTNANRLFSFGTVAVMQDSFGRVFILTDSPSLFLAGAPDNYFTIGLVEGGAICENNNDLFTNTVVDNGTENIIASVQSEWTFNLRLKGYAWDVTNGGKSPNDTAIGTGTNWDKVATDNKDTAGVIAQTL